MMLSMKPGNLACQYPIPKPTRVAGPDPVFLSVISGSSFLEESILLDHDQEKLDPDPRDEDPVLAKKPDPGLCTSNEGRFLEVS